MPGKVVKKRLGESIRLRRRSGTDWVAGCLASQFFSVWRSSSSSIYDQWHLVVGISIHPHRFRCHGNLSVNIQKKNIYSFVSRDTNSYLLIERNIGFSFALHACWIMDHQWTCGSAENGPISKHCAIRMASPDVMRCSGTDVHIATLGQELRTRHR